MTEKKVRLRFAPSPTGGLHMGGVRTALFNYLFARKHGGDFILRIEDTDQNRYVKGAEEYIINALKWTGIEINEGVGIGGPHAPYRQSERKELGIYEKYALQLVESGHAYYAFDTSAELEDMRKRLEASKSLTYQYSCESRMQMRNSLTLPESEWKEMIKSGVPHVIRLKMPPNEDIRFYDMIRGWVVVHSSQVDDKVLLKSDGMPTYHLAHIVDDYLMEISHAVRGEEWLPSAPAHVLIYRYLGWEDKMPQLAHLPLILKPDGNGKLSKRDKSGLPMFPLNWYDERTGESYIGYRESGFFPEAFANMLAMLGWNPGTTQELFSMTELIEAFSLERVHKSGAKFDPEKTRWFNQQYLRKKSNEELATLFLPVLEEKIPGASEKFNSEFLLSFCGLMKEKVHFVSELWDLGAYFFIAPLNYDADVVKKRWNAEISLLIKDIRDNWQKMSVWNALETENIFKETCAAKSVGPGQVMQILRVCLTGLAGGAALFDMVAIIGQDNTIERLNEALKKLPIYEQS